MTGAGCAPNRTPRRAVLNVIAVDRSGSTETMRELQRRLLTAAFQRAGKFSESVAIYTVDRETSCVFTPQKLQPGQRVSKYVLDKLKTPSDSSARLTRPARFWNEMVDRYSRPDPSQTIRILYLTDGGDDYSESKDIEKAAKALASNNSVSVGLLGVIPSHESTLQNQFSVFGDGRLVVRVGNDPVAFFDGLHELRSLEIKQ